MHVIFLLLTLNAFHVSIWTLSLYNTYNNKRLFSTLAILTVIPTKGDGATFANDNFTYASLVPPISSDDKGTPTAHKAKRAYDTLGDGLTTCAGV